VRIPNGLVEREKRKLLKELKVLERIYHRKLTREERYPIYSTIMKCPMLTLYEAWRLSKCGR
jgi:hypothetical protein